MHADGNRPRLIERLPRVSSISASPSIDPTSCFCQPPPLPTASFYIIFLCSNFMFLSLSLPSFLYLAPSLLPSPCSIHPSIHPSACSHLIAANLRRGSLEGFSAGLCSTGLLNAACGEGEWALRGRLDMSSVAATVYKLRPGET